MYSNDLNIYFHYSFGNNFTLETGGGYGKKNQSILNFKILI